MNGETWALIAGTGFGLFQSLNRRAVLGMDVYFATFIQLLISSIVLAGIALFTLDLHILSTISLTAILYFSTAGLLHFFIGWTFLNASQKKIGASRTSPLIGTTPLFATVISAVVLKELPGWLSMLGIGLIVYGAYVISEKSSSKEDKHIETGWKGAWLGLSASICWSISPYFIRAGLSQFPSPLLGVTIGSAVSALVYLVILLFQGKTAFFSTTTTDAWVFKILAGIFVGLSTWARWIALDLAPVPVVLAITMVSTPLVILLSPFVSGKNLERVTISLWVGTALILGGALLLTFIV